MSETPERPVVDATDIGALRMAADQAAELAETARQDILHIQACEARQRLSAAAAEHGSLWLAEREGQPVDEVTAEAERVIAENTRELREAQRELDAAQARVSRARGRVEACRTMIEMQREAGEEGSRP